MRHSPPIRTAACAVLVALVAIGCAKKEEATPAADEAAPEASMPDLPDTTGAAVWAYLEAVGYQDNWALWPDKGELYTGQEPHGMLLTSYLNEAALEALSTHAGAMPPGAIVIKENYMPDSTLAAVTVMYKVEGFNPDHNDWYFTKHLPDGSLDKAPNGMALEGRVPGCQSCHTTKSDNDYIFTGSLSAM